MTKDGICLLNAKQLTNLIGSIERLLPGYWYSISQVKDKLNISLGATPYCLLDVDRAWSKTKEGDAGIHVSIGTARGTERISTSQIVADIVKWVEVERRKILDSGCEMPPYIGTYRKHSQEDLEKFKKRYNRFLNEDLDHIESLNSIFREIYIESCNLSVDVSLRGTDVLGCVFDESHDYTGDKTLAYSLDMAIADVKSNAKGSYELSSKGSDGSVSYSKKLFLSDEESISP